MIPYSQEFQYSRQCQPNTQLAGITRFHCFAGIAGDMALGALVDAGADLEKIQKEEIKKICSQLNLADWELTAEKTQRSGIAGDLDTKHLCRLAW